MRSKADALASDITLSNGHDAKLHSAGDFPPRSLACGQLDRDLRPALATHAPLRHLRRDREHPQVAVAEHDVDREAHEERVNRPTRAQQDPFPRRQLLASEQSAEAKGGIRCHDTPFAHDTAGLQLDLDDLGHAVTLAGKAVGANHLRRNARIRPRD